MPTKNNGRTAAGEPITDDLVERLAAKAEAGFDVDEILRRRGGGRQWDHPRRFVESVRLDPEPARRCASAPRPKGAATGRLTASFAGVAKHYGADLAARFHRAAIEGRWATTMRFFDGPTLLVIDELGYPPLPAEAASAQFQVATDSATTTPAPTHSAAPPPAPANYYIDPASQVGNFDKHIWGISVSAILWVRTSIERRRWSTMAARALVPTERRKAA